MMGNQRQIWGDSLKGCLILLVVLGHAIQNTIGQACVINHLWNIIYSFHMPAFMAVSGFFAYHMNRPVEDTIYCRIILRRFRQLVIPFALWTIFLLLNSNILSSETIGLYLLYPDKGLWFLWVLFIICVIFIFGEWLAKRINVRQELLELSFCVLLSGIMVIFEVRVLGFQFISYYFLFYSLGYYLHKYYDIVISKKLYVIIPLTICWGVMAWHWQMHELPSLLKVIPLPGTITQYMYRFITATIAIYLLLAVSPIILNRTEKWNVPFVRMGIVSLGIYTVHFILLGRFVRMYSHLDVNDSLIILFSFVTGVIASCFIVWILSKWEVTLVWLLGKV